LSRRINHRDTEDTEKIEERIAIDEHKSAQIRQAKGRKEKQVRQ
jgi:hypothetical protein